MRESTIQLSQMVRLARVLCHGSALTLLQNDAFAETGGILSGTFRRMNNMLRDRAVVGCGTSSFSLLYSGSSWLYGGFGGDLSFPHPLYSLPSVHISLLSFMLFPTQMHKQGVDLFPVHAHALTGTQRKQDHSKYYSSNYTNREISKSEQNGIAHCQRSSRSFALPNFPYHPPSQVRHVLL